MIAKVDTDYTMCKQCEEEKLAIKRRLSLEPGVVVPVANEQLQMTWLLLGYGICLSIAVIIIEITSKLLIGVYKKCTTKPAPRIIVQSRRIAWEKASQVIQPKPVRKSIMVFKKGSPSQ